MTSEPLTFYWPLDDLEPFTRYVINIAIKPVASPYWSDSTTVTGRTLAEGKIASCYVYAYG